MEKVLSSNSASLQQSNEKPAFRGLFLPDEKKLCSECGQPEKVEYAYNINKDGSLVLEPVGKTNVYDLIQASADDCDINIIVARFRNGEEDIADRVYGTFADVVDAPRTYAEMHQRLIDANAAFDSLPPDFKEKFNNNPVEYYTQYGSDEFNAKVSSYLGFDDSIDHVGTVVDEKGVDLNDQRTNE